MKKENKEITDVDSAVEELKGFAPDLEIYGRIYRITSPVDSVGRPSSEFVGKVTEFVDEDFVGRTFGPGSYKIHYRIKDSQNTDEKDVKFNIGKEYARKDEPAKSQPAAPTPVLGGLDIGGLLGGLTIEKITAIGAAVKMIKDFLAPPPPPVDLTKLLEIVAANNRPQSVSDAVIIQAMQSLQKQNAQPSILQQMRELKEIKETLKDDETAGDSDGEGGQMNFLIEQAFKYLPALLTAKQNNFQAVGQQVRENPMIAGLIANNPDLAKQFIDRAAQTYGVENARKLAAGFGYEMQSAQPAQEQPGEGVEMEA